MNIVNEKLNKRHSAFVIFKPHLVFFSYETSDEIQYQSYNKGPLLNQAVIKLSLLNKRFSFFIRHIINTSFKNEEQVKKFYPHIIDKPFFKDIKRDYLENSRINNEGKIADFNKEEDRENIQYKKTNYFIAFVLEDNLKIPRSEKEFYSDIRKMVDFSEKNSCKKEISNLVDYHKHTFGHYYDHKYAKNFLSLRDSYALDKTYNSVHGTDSEESFKREKEVILSALNDYEKKNIISLSRDTKYMMFIDKNNYQIDNFNYDTIYHDFDKQYDSIVNYKNKFYKSHNVPFNGIQKYYLYHVTVYKEEEEEEENRNYIDISEEPHGMKYLAKYPFRQNYRPNFIICYGKKHVKLKTASFVYLKYIVNQSNITRQEKKQNLDWGTFKATSLME